MQQQKSFEEENSGALWIVPTPIGNLQDMTFRAVETLKQASVIAAEDTRNTKKLLNHFEIDTPLVSYHEHNKHVRGPQLVERMTNGDMVAVVSDAGMPGISDPGTELAQLAIEAGISVIPLPGANAALPALAASGLSTDAFYFYGFLPRKRKERAEVLERLQTSQATMIFYESPHRLKEMLNHVYEAWGSRQAVLARELTKRYEEFIRGTLDELVQWAEDSEIRGEFCVLVEGSKEEVVAEDHWWADLSIIEHVDHYMETESMKNKAAIKQVALDRKLPKREVYQAYHVE